MFSFNAQRGGFATIAIISGVAVAVAAGGLFYFLRGNNPVEIDTVFKDDSAAVFDEEAVLSVDAEEVLLRSLPRGRTNDYCSLLGLEREACADGAEAVCRDLFGSCSIDLSRDSSDTLRQFAEACLVLRTAEGRSQYFTWLDSGDPKPFPLYYAIFGLEEGVFSQKQLADAYQALLDSYFSTTSCDNRAVLRLLAEGYLVLGNTEGRAIYNEWLNDANGDPFSLYYAVFGLRRGAFTQQQLTDAYKKLLDQYFSGYYGNNVEVLRLLTEAYMVLRESSSAYNSFLGGGLSSSLSDVSFDLNGGSLIAILDDLDLSSGNLAILLDAFDLSPEGLGAILGNLDLSPEDLGAVLGGLDLSPESLSAVLGTLDLSPEGLGSILGTLDLSPEGLGSVLGDLDLSSANLSAVLGNLNLSTDSLSALLSNLSLSAGDLSAVLGDLDLSSENLSSVLGNLRLSTDNLSALLNNLNLSTGDLSAVLGTLDLSSENLSAVLGNLNLSTDSLSALLSNLNLSTDDLSAVLSNLNLSSVDLSAVLGNLTIPSIDIRALSTTLNIPSLGGGGGGPSSGVTTSPDDADDLPAVAIYPVPASGQIGVDNDTVPQISFRLEVTKDGSLYIPDSAITVALNCSQSTPSLIQGDLPESVLLSADEGATDALVRIPDVTGHVACAVASDTAADPAYRPGFPSSVQVTVVGGSSGTLCGQPPCPDDSFGDPFGDPLPGVSIAAVESSVASGQPAVFRVFADTDIQSSLQVRYACSVSDSAVVGGGNLQETTKTILSDSREFSITIGTAANTSGSVECRLLDRADAYTILKRAASVGVGLVSSTDVEDFDPVLPTVSLIAYRTAAETVGGSTVTRSRSTSSALVDTGDVYFGFVVDDPAADSFGTEISRSREQIFVGETNGLYVLYETDSGSTISVLPDPKDTSVIKVGILGPSSLLADVSGLPARINRPFGYASSAGAKLQQYPWRYPGGSGNFDANGISIQTTSDNRVIMRDSVKGEATICGYDGGTLYCARYEDADGFALTPIRVTAQCFRDFSDRDRVQEVSNLLVGGRYGEVSNYIADDDDPQGVLYQFVSSDGNYISAAEGSEGTSVASGINPFLDPNTTFSCEISGGGAEDGFNVLVRRAAVRVYPRPVVSIESGGLEDVEDVSAVGIPAAAIPYGQQTTEFAQGSQFSGPPDPNDSLPPDENASFGEVLTNLGASVGVGFLTSFGSCVGANLLNKGISAIASKLGFGDGNVPTKNENLEAKECSLDGAASAAVMEVLTAVTRDYIVWAHEGFEDKPLFVRNPTTFYKNFHDDAIGRVIDRSGLGFLCDIGVPNFDAYRATLKVNLQQRYQGIAADRPRCTYSDLTNNLEEFYDDASSLITDFSYDDLVKHGFSLDLDVTARTQFAGNVSLSPKSDAGNQLDALSATLDRVMKKTEKGSNFLLATSKMDSEVREAEQDFAAAAKPPSQFFNPNDPTSVAAFKACGEAENPEGDVDCLLLNVSGSRFTEEFGKATDGHFDRLLQVDEFGEIGQLAKLAVNATSAGLMKKNLRNGFGVTVGRETADILTGITDSFASASTPYGVNRVDISGTWWSAFFQDNGVYKSLLGAEMYEKDIHTLYDYIGRSFYEDPGRSRDGRAIPPVTPYTAFATVVNSSNVPGGYPTGASITHQDITESIVNRAYVGVYESEDLADDFNERRFKKLITGDEGFVGEIISGLLIGFTAGATYPWLKADKNKSWVKSNLSRVFGDGGSWGKQDGGYAAYNALKRFNQVYPFMRYYDNRLQYNAFVERDDSLLVEASYKYYPGNWQKNTLLGKAEPPESSVPSLFLPLQDGVKSITDGAQVVQYPAHYNQVKEAMFTLKTSARLVNGSMLPVGTRCPPQCIDRSDRNNVCRNGVIVGANISPDTIEGQCAGSRCDQAGERLEFTCKEVTAESPEECFIETDVCSQFGKKSFTCTESGVRDNIVDAAGASVSFSPHVSAETVGRPACSFDATVKLKDSNVTVSLGRKNIFCVTGDSAATCKFTWADLSGYDRREPYGDGGQRFENVRTPIDQDFVNCTGLFGRTDDHGSHLAGTLSFNAKLEETSPAQNARCVVSTPPSKVSSAAQVYGSLQAVEAMREMYEATILTHIALVGQVDEYESGRTIDSAIHTYRQGILAESDHASPFDRWKLVQDATLKRFRDGTMPVYIPIDNKNRGSQYGNICKVTGTALSDGNYRDDIIAHHPSFTRRYRKTECILGTVFQDQAYFIVRRKNSGYPGLLERPLTVRLACGYDAVPASSDELRYSIEKPVKSDTVTLHPNQDVVLYTAPILSDLFDSGAFQEGRFGKVRCSIAGAAYGRSLPTEQDSENLIDEDMLTATVTVSEHEKGRTLHTRMAAVLKNPDADERISRMAAALYYTYLLGWSTGFIKMPYFSTQDLLSALPYTVPGNEGKSVLQAINNQENLRRYRLLASLFVDESDDRFDTEHFGFLTPDEARDKFENYYGDRFDAYFGRALGSFLQKLSPQYRQR